MNMPVFDLHCDTALALLGKDLNSAGNLLKNDYHIDLERAGKLDGFVQCFACFTTSIPEPMNHISPILVFERELATIQREVDKNSDRIAIAYSPEEIRHHREIGMMSAILTLEGTAGIGYDPALLEDQREKQEQGRQDHHFDFMLHTKTAQSVSVGGADMPGGISAQSESAPLLDQGEERCL